MLVIILTIAWPRNCQHLKVAHHWLRDREGFVKQNTLKTITHRGMRVERSQNEISFKYDKVSWDTLLSRKVNSNIRPLNILPQYDGVSNYHSRGFPHQYQLFIRSFTFIHSFTESLKCSGRYARCWTFSPRLQGSRPTHPKAREHHLLAPSQRTLN